MRYIPKILFWLSVAVFCTSAWAWSFYNHPFWSFIVLVGLVCAIGALVLIAHFKKEGI